MYFSDEFHFPITVVANGKKVTRKRGERYRVDKVQRKARTTRQDKKQQKETGITRSSIHMWVLIHYEERHYLFYTVGNNTGKMTQATYTQQCLPFALPILRRYGLTLQEDKDKSHYGKVSQQYKRDHGISTLLSPTVSPDLSVAETLARPFGQLYGSRGHYEEKEAREHIIEYFYQIKQSDIQKWILGMPNRLQRVRDGGGEGLPDF